MGYCWAVASPDEAVIVSGVCLNNKPRYIRGGCTHVVPCCQQVQFLDLRVMTLSIMSERVYTKEGVPMKVMGTAQVKIDTRNTHGVDIVEGDVATASLIVSAENFLGKKQKHIADIAQETLEGHQRAIMGTMTVEEIYQDRNTFSDNVLKIAEPDMANMGLNVVTYNIRDVDDYSGYLKALEVKPVAERNRDATIGQANAHRDKERKKAMAEEKQLKQNLVDRGHIEESNYNLEVTKLKNLATTREREVKANLAYQLQEYKNNVDIVNSKMNMKIEEKQNQISVLKFESDRKERELEATVNAPVRAEMARQLKIAKADQSVVIMEAEAEAEAIRLEGEAEAYALRAKGKAEAEAKKKAAEAYKEYDRNAMVDLYLEQLPRIAAEVAAPLQSVNQINMVSTGDGDVGVARVMGEVTAMVDQVVGSVANATGIHLQDTIKGMK